jgi:hypothetical protein
MKNKETWEEKFDKEFGHHGETWNGKKGSKDELEIRQFIRTQIEQAERRGFLEAIRGYTSKTYAETIEEAEKRGAKETIAYMGKLK